jgi:uncharacterized protein (TIGR02284 family)
MTDNLKKLHTYLVDNRKGYEEAAKDAEPELKAFFAGMIALKQRDHIALHSALERLGEVPDDSGSFMAVVHETVISVRSALTGLGTNALGSFVMGEKQVVEQYDKAIEECAKDPATETELRAQKSALLQKIAQMEAMKGSS